MGNSEGYAPGWSEDAIDMMARRGTFTQCWIESDRNTSLSVVATTVAVIEAAPGMPIRAACCTVMTRSPRRHPWCCPGTALYWHERLEDRGSIHAVVLLEICNRVVSAPT
jgi:hypothetical protein